MDNNRFAIIDLGTNTFHLLIVDLQNGVLIEKYRERIFVKLAEGGIDTIHEDAYARGIHTISKYRALIEDHEVPLNQVKAVGTAALRTASNGQAFVNEIFDRTQISIELISGNREAELISKGIQLAIGSIAETSLIMDIGGGSTEFILLENGKNIWAKSFPVGIAVLFNLMKYDDPISQEQINDVKKYLIKICTPLLDKLRSEEIINLIGASGSFEVVNDFLEEKVVFKNHREIKSTQFPPVYKQLMQSTLAERLAMEQLPETRAEMIGMAMILMQFALEASQASKILISDYALKEGILAEMV
ncbi:MAG: hypothetical protein AAGK97_07470 [Bacteroidota bacterium]